MYEQYKADWVYRAKNMSCLHMRMAFYLVSKHANVYLVVECIFCIFGHSVRDAFDYDISLKYVMEIALRKYWFC